MKNVYKLIALLLTISHQCFTQSTDPKVDLNLLRGPVSPAANLLGITPSDIQRPTDLPAFNISTQNSNNASNAFPDNIALDIVPFWLFGKKGSNVSFKDFNSNKNSIIQTLTISTSVKNWKSKNNIDSTSQLGLGFRFSIFRGKFDDLELNQLFTNLNNQHNINLKILDSLQENNPKYKKLKIMIRDLESSDLSDSLKEVLFSLQEEMFFFKLSVKY